MIVKQLIEYETATGRVLTAPSRCRNCALACGSMLQRQPAASEPPDARRVTVALDAPRLHKVVFVLYGVPLFVMAVAVSFMQFAQLDQWPLACLALLAVLLVFTAKLVTPHGARLLNLLQVQTFPLPASNSRNTT